MHPPKSSATRSGVDDLVATLNPSEWNGPDDEVACKERWILRLYVSGQTARSLRAVANLERICTEQLQGRFKLEVIDLYQQPQLAQGEQIVAVPALIRRLPAPLRMLIGDMSDSDSVLIGLALLPM